QRLHIFGVDDTTIHPVLGAFTEERLDYLVDIIRSRIRVSRDRIRLVEGSFSQVGVSLIDSLGDQSGITIHDSTNDLFRNLISLVIFDSTENIVSRLEEP